MRADKTPRNRKREIERKCFTLADWMKWVKQSENAWAMKEESNNTPCVSSKENFWRPKREQWKHAFLLLGVNEWCANFSAASLICLCIYVLGIFANVFFRFYFPDFGYCFLFSFRMSFGWAKVWQRERMFLLFSWNNNSFEIVFVSSFKCCSFRLSSDCVLITFFQFNTFK